MNKPINLAIFASGSGTNAENISKHFEDHDSIQVKEILSNRKSAGVHARAEKLEIPSATFSREQFNDPSFIKQLSDFDYIILAGFLWLIPRYLIKAFPNKIINIHPALLPKFGGKGMYGTNVHKAVIESGDKESGITIHLVNEEYDKGKILFQSKCEVAKNDTPESLAQKIHALEYEHFPKVIERVVLG
ncbi:formyltetrahydrofolate-dependent phosphoribosylglycinamide formyltransferase [Ekhidna lutea]|uniref:Phosphoribosylglycinamide formyltransferase n=1 Tax=Ekhidna lutea TaxID=447679 RepID=A0A239ES33_EKHLU|nr:phosphoribosylglycinamide formyltransferase [Ekhidna lutea]SNS46843.1 formyltetrahydrofolate-dependent phosphoribosylglycinamide formyltransferase [Ekhidna lutea]